MQRCLKETQQAKTHAGVRTKRGKCANISKSADFVRLFYQFFFNATEFVFPFESELLFDKDCSGRSFTCEEYKRADSRRDGHSGHIYIPVWFMTSQTLTARHKMAAVMAVLSRVWNVDFSQARQ